MSPRQVTVFGASGFVGRHVVRRLASAGIRVIAASRHAEAAGFLKTMGNIGQVTPLSCDVGDRDRVAAVLEGSDGAVNLVGILYQTPRRRFADLHGTAPGTIAAAASAAGIDRFVHVSAIGADQPRLSNYAATKGAGERAATAALPETVILRPSVIFGAEDDFFNRFAALARVTPALPLFGGGDNRFQPVYVGDVAEAVLAGLTRDDVLGRVFELGGPEICSFRQLMVLLCAEIGRRRLLLPLPMAAADFIGFWGDLAARMGVRPQLTRDQAKMLRTDNVVGPGADGLAALGLRPRAMGSVLPSYLARYRPGRRAVH